jgi:hypothetical protein
MFIYFVLYNLSYTIFTRFLDRIWYIGSERYHKYRNMRETDKPVICDKHRAKIEILWTDLKHFL